MYIQTNRRHIVVNVLKYPYMQLNDRVTLVILALIKL